MNKMRKIWWPLFLTLLLSLGGGLAAGKATTIAYTYRGEDARHPTQRFSPHDTISLRVRIKALAAGQYALQAEWINPLQEKADTTDHIFDVFSHDTEYAADFSLSLLKAGFFSRQLSATDPEGFSARCYGRWRVRVYLDGEEIVYKDFEIR